MRNLSHNASMKFTHENITRIRMGNLRDLAPLPLFDTDQFRPFVTSLPMYFISRDRNI